MRHLILASAALALLGLAPVAVSAAPMERTVIASPAPAITYVAGWWEQENHADAPDRYWQLKHSDYNRYNSAQARIDARHRKYHLDNYDARDRKDLAEQHHLLLFRFQ